MAQEEKTPTAAEKGKGKAVDAQSKKTDEAKKDKDGKVIANGKEDGDRKEGKTLHLTRESWHSGASRISQG